MKKETRRTLRELGYYSTLGISIALSIFIGLFAGVYLDGRWGTHPLLTFIGLGLGIAAGFKNIAMAVKKSRKL